MREGVRVLLWNLHTMKYIILYFTESTVYTTIQNNLLIYFNNMSFIKNFFLVITKNGRIENSCSFKELKCNLKCRGLNIVRNTGVFPLYAWFCNVINKQFCGRHFFFFLVYFCEQNKFNLLY